MFLLYGVVQILQAVVLGFLNIMCHVSKNYFMNNLALSSEELTRQATHRIIIVTSMPIPEASCHAETKKGSTWTNVEGK